MDTLGVLTVRVKHRGARLIRCYLQYIHPSRNHRSAFRLPRRQAREIGAAALVATALSLWCRAHFRTWWPLFAHSHSLTLSLSLKHTHTSNLGFQLTQLSQWEGRRWNGKVERSAEKVLFNTGFTTSASGGGGQQLQCSGKPVCGESIMWNHHESNQKSGQRVQKFIEQVHNAASRIASPRADSVFVGQCLSVVHCPPACVKWEEWWGKTLCPGWDTHRSPHSALFSKTGGRRGSYAPFGHIGSRVQPQQRQRWRVGMCIFEWCGVVIGGLIEPSAGSRRLWNPGFSRVEKVACR